MGIEREWWEGGGVAAAGKKLPQTGKKKQVKLVEEQ